jgi:hypothetical protein
MLTKIFSVYTILFVKSMYILLLHLVRCLSTSNYKLSTKFPRPSLYSYYQYVYKALFIFINCIGHQFTIHRLVWLDSHLLLVELEILEEK